MRSRSRSIRSRLVLLLLVPLLSLTALWAFSASITLGPGLSLVHVGTLVDFARTADTLSGALQSERRAAAVQAAKPSPESLAILTAAEKQTDRARTTFFRQADGDAVQASIKPQAVKDIEAYRTATANLRTIRSQLAAGGGTVQNVMAMYETALDASYTVTDGTIITFGDADFAGESRNVLDLARARDTLSQEDAVMAAILARGGSMTPADEARFAQAMGVQRYSYAQVVPKLSPMLRSRSAAIEASPEYLRLRSMEDRAVSQTRRVRHLPFSARQWQTTTAQVMKDQQKALLAGADELTADGEPIAVRILGQLAATALFGLVAVVASLLISLRIGRSLIRELRRLRHSAREVAEQRLPAVVRRLRLGEEIDVDAEVVESAYRVTEMAQVGAALGSVQRTAMEEAIAESRLRTGIRGVFVNLARRSQALLHRQLKLLDGMERAADDPDELERLFQLDHLATRMRRHSEGLIILSGSTPGRNWRRPVPMIDVMRAAVAEVEDYQRVTVAPMPDAALSGPAVGDVVHLVAELVENATLYSPPHTGVQVTAEYVGNGYVVEIHDRGLSMSREDLAEANRKLADPPEFDPADSAQLGLFVVARLARRHSIRVSLRVSPYGGTTAILLLPAELVITDDGAVVDTGPFGERVRPAGVGTGSGADDDEGLGATGRLQSAPEEPDGAADADRPAHVAPVPDLAAETPAPDPYDRTEDPDLARRGAAGPYPTPPESELPRTDGGLPRRVRTEVRDGEAATDAPSTPAGAVPFAVPGESAPPSTPNGDAARAGDLFVPRTDPGPLADPAPLTDPGPVQSDRGDLPPLPKRVRQASLAPELRTDTAAADLEDALGLGDAQPAGGRTPEQARSLMESFQQGWLRGRAADPGPEHDPGPAHAGEPAKEEH